MIFNKTSIYGAYQVDLQPMVDERGLFARAWSQKEFAEFNLETDFPEINYSVSSLKGTIRGLHYQKSPHAEAKFVRCVRGAFFDVIVDLRPDSPTFQQWAGFEVSASSRNAIYVPAGCAHGVQSLEDHTEMLYLVSACYAAGFEGGIRWDDPFFRVEWPATPKRIVSSKDQSWPDYVPDSIS